MLLTCFCCDLSKGSFMKILIVYWHFNDTSFTHQIYAHCVQKLTHKGHEVKARNLHKARFNPITSTQDLAAAAGAGPLAEDVVKEQHFVQWADALLFIYPIWWWDRPAAIKGWCDRVLTKGFAFNYGPEGVDGLLKNKKGLAIQTLGMPQSMPLALENSYMFQNSLVEGTLGFCGIEDADVLTLYGVLHMNTKDALLAMGQINTFLDCHF